MAHHFDVKFYNEQKAIKEKASAEAVSHNEKTWSNLKSEEKDKIAFVSAQKIGTAPEAMLYK